MKSAQLWGRFGKNGQKWLDNAEEEACDADDMIDGIKHQISSSDHYQQTMKSHDASVSIIQGC